LYSLPAFTELLTACQRHIQFLSKARKVATHLMDRDFIHLKNPVPQLLLDLHPAPPSQPPDDTNLFLEGVQMLVLQP
jgi:hypothetical protein